MASVEENNNNSNDRDNMEDIELEPCDKMDEHPENTSCTKKLDSDIIVSMDENSQCDNDDLDTDSDTSELRLVDLPSEILIHIASFLESRVIIDALSQVCQMLSDLFSSERYWKTRISLRWPKPYPIVEREDFDWHIACMEREEIYRRWTNTEEHFHHFMFTEGFFAAVDIVHLMKGGQQLAIGSRDRHFNIVDLTKFDCDNPTNKHKDLLAFNDTRTHKGWVWSMASCDNTLATGSWDTHIRLWDLGDGTVQCCTDLRIFSAVLGLHFEPGFIAAAGYDKQLWMLDPRSQDVICKKKYHSQPLLSIAADDKYIITGSEDKVISIYDRAAGKNYKKITTDSFIMDMSYGQGQLWTGDKEGKLHVLDASDGLFDDTTMQTLDVGHTGSLVGVAHTDGGIFTASTDHQIKVVEPCLNPDIITTLKCHSNAVARISYQNGVLASAGTDIAVGIWIPKDRKF